MKRADFLKLVQMDTEAFKSIGRRNQLPFISEEDAKFERRPGYSPFEAILLMICNDLVHYAAMDRAKAAEVTQYLINDLYLRWDDIQLSLHSDNAPPIFCAVKWLQSFRESVCGTEDEIQFGADAILGIKVNISRIFRALKARAKEADVEIDAKFWMTSLEVKQYYIDNPDWD